MKVAEFQHSQIKPEEREARENFYKKMIWVVDGTTRQKDYLKFFEYSESFYSNAVRRLRSSFNECTLLRDWGDSKTAIFFDFPGDILWVLLPKIIEKRYVMSIKRGLLSLWKKVRYRAFFPLWQATVAVGKLANVRDSSRRKLALDRTFSV